jgi:tRNA U34 5-methylaminomethyl-2-thiouridine-forming methyltransferase MnmC
MESKKIKHPEIITTEDGSNSICLEDINESYHSKFGAIRESRHVFIEAGFNRVKELGRINVLEVGFGTGLNALLTLLEAHEKKIKVIYDTIEPFPLPMKVAEILNFPEILVSIPAVENFKLLHDAAYGSFVKISDFFILRKFKRKLGEIDLDENKYNLIYFDAFSPAVQPELWTFEIFKKLFISLKIKGLIVTYCAKGEVRRNLKEAGFLVERLAGPKGKREILRGTKQ